LLFTLDGTTYLLTTDYFSWYPKVIKLMTTTSASIIGALKSIFSRYGIPEEVVSDNGPQYSLQEFDDFAKEYGF
jgi:transposase InsO family protein